MASVELKLAACAAYNGRMMHDMNLTRENLRNDFLLQLSNFFHFEPQQALLGTGVEMSLNAFDEKAILQEAESIPDDGSGYYAILSILGEIGFRAAPKPPDEFTEWMIEAHLWKKAIDRLRAERDKDKELSH